MTQAYTLQPSRTAAQMALALERVDVVRIGDLMEARRHGTGQVVGTAVQSRHPQSDYAGWLVQAGTQYREIVISPAVAEVVLLYMASLVIGGDVL